MSRWRNHGPTCLSCDDVPGIGTSASGQSSPGAVNGGWLATHDSKPGLAATSPGGARCRARRLLGLGAGLLAAGSWWSPRGPCAVPRRAAVGRYAPWRKGSSAVRATCVSATSAHWSASPAFARAPPAVMGMLADSSGSAQAPPAAIRPRREPRSHRRGPTCGQPSPRSAVAHEPDLRPVGLAGADLTGTDLTGAGAFSAVWPGGSALRQAREPVLSGADLGGAKPARGLAGADLWRRPRRCPSGRRGPRPCEFSQKPEPPAPCGPVGQSRRAGNGTRVLAS